MLAPYWAGTPVASATGDAAVLRAILEVEAALATAQAGLGLVPDATATAIAEAAGVLTLDAAEIALESRRDGNPVIPVLGRLRGAVGTDASGYVHLGATSQDILDTALVLVARRSIRSIAADLDTVVTALADLADSHRRTPMAARTLTQHSLPTTFGVKAAGWLVAAADARGFLTAVGDALPVQLGGAAGTLASLEQLAPGRAFDVVDALASALDLMTPPLPWHTMRTPMTKLADALTGVCDALGTIGRNAALLSRTEIGELHEQTGGGSSAMPQKQNPVRSILLQSATRPAPGLAAELHRSASTVDERPDGAWHAEWQTLRELLRLTGGAASLAADLLTGLRVDGDRMRDNLQLTAPLIVSERIMLVTAHVLGRDRVKQLIAAAADDPASLRDSLARELPGWEPERLDELLDPLNYLGAVDAIVDRALAHVRGTDG
jgi:3-carboxy-cis,cis-muconate cycloisomerase